MTRRADVLVVGGGVMGASIAMHLGLAKAGRVWLIERTHPGAGSSGKSGAILRQHYSHRETVRMAKTSLEFFEHFESTHGIDIGFERHGMVFITDATQREQLAALVAMQREEGVPTRMVDATDLAAIEPRGFYPDDVAACYEENAATVQPLATVFGLLEVAHNAGVSISTGEELLSLKREGSRVTGATTSHGDIEADHVVLATGPWSVRLLKELGWSLPLEVVRPETTYLRTPPAFAPPSTVFADLSLGTYWRPEIGCTRVGSVDTDADDRVDDPANYDETANPNTAQHHRRQIAQRIPGFEHSVVWAAGGALYTLTPDSHPIVGPPADAQGVTLVTGFSGHGFKLSPAIGDGVARWIMHGDPGRWPAPFFSPERFTRGEMHGSGYGRGLLG